MPGMERKNLIEKNAEGDLNTNALHERLILIVQCRISVSLSILYTVQTYS